MTRCAGWLSTEPASVLHRRFVSLANEPTTWRSAECTSDPSGLASRNTSECGSSSSLTPMVAARTFGCLTVGKLSGVVRNEGAPASKTALMISVGGQIIEVGGAAIAISTAFSVRPWACPSRSARDRRLVPRSGRAAGRVTRCPFLKNLPCTRVLVSIVPPPRSAPSLRIVFSRPPDKPETAGRFFRRRFSGCASVSASCPPPRPAGRVRDYNVDGKR